MNCDTYLSMLETLPIEELGYAEAREHVAHCHDCDRVTRVVLERERSMRMAFGDLYPPIPAGPIAARALVMARRRTVALYYRIALGVAALATIVALVLSRRVVPASASRVSETFRLQCLSPDQALEVLRPVISPRVAMSAQASNPVAVIRVSAPPEEMNRVRSVLDRYDGPAASPCVVQLTVPKVISVP